MAFSNFRQYAMSIVSENKILINVSSLGYFMNLIFCTPANVSFDRSVKYFVISKKKSKLLSAQLILCDRPRNLVMRGVLGNNFGVSVFLCLCNFGCVILAISKMFSETQAIAQHQLF